MANKPNLTYALGNRLATTLDGSITDDATTINVVDASGFKATGGYALIDKANEATREIVYVESVSSNVLTIATDGRGLAGTTAVAHSSGVTIQDVAVDDMINGLVDQFKVGHTDAGAHVLPNNTALSIKESGGTARDIVKVTSGNILQVGYNTLPLQIIGKNDGWNSIGDTWTYASATTITVPAGAASYYAIGGKIKLTQTTVKYFYIVDVADELLTITGGTSYTLASAAISEISYSNIENPVGFPIKFDWTPVVTGKGSLTWTSSNTVYAYFRMSGQYCHVTYQIYGTTGGTTSDLLYITTPIKPAINAVWYGSVSRNNSTFVHSTVRTSNTNNRFEHAANSDGTSWTLAANSYVVGDFAYPVDL